MLITYFQLLKIITADIRSKCQKNDPFFGKFEKRLNRISPHVRGNRYRIKIKTRRGFIKESAGIKPRSVANIATFGIGNRKTFFRNILNRTLQTFPAFCSQCFIKSNIWLVCYGIINGCVYNLAVKFKNGVFFF